MVIHQHEFFEELMSEVQDNISLCVFHCLVPFFMTMRALPELFHKKRWQVRVGLLSSYLGSFYVFFAVAAVDLHDVFTTFLPLQR